VVVNPSGVFDGKGIADFPHQRFRCTGNVDVVSEGDFHIGSPRCAALIILSDSTLASGVPWRYGFFQMYSGMASSVFVSKRLSGLLPKLPKGGCVGFGSTSGEGFSDLNAFNRAKYLLITTPSDLPCTKPWVVHPAQTEKWSRMKASQDLPERLKRL